MAPRGRWWLQQKCYLPDNLAAGNDQGKVIRDQYLNRL